MVIVRANGMLHKSTYKCLINAVVIQKLCFSFINQEINNYLSTEASHKLRIKCLSSSTACLKKEGSLRRKPEPRWADRLF